MLCHGGPFAHLDAPAAECLNGGKAGLVGNVIAHKDRRAARKGWLRHEVDDGLALVNATGFHFKDAFAAQQFHTVHLPHGLHQRVVAQGFEVGRQAVVQGDAHAFGLHQQAGVARCQGLCGLQYRLQGGWCGGGHRSVKEAVLGPMFARQWQAQRRQKSVDIGFGPAGHDSQRATQLGVQR